VIPGIYKDSVASPPSTDMEKYLRRVGFLRLLGHESGMISGRRAALTSEARWPITTSSGSAGAESLCGCMVGIYLGRVNGTFNEGPKFLTGMKNGVPLGRSVEQLRRGFKSCSLDLAITSRNDSSRVRY
jgi:hypothetical protein